MSDSWYYDHVRQHHDEQGAVALAILALIDAVEDLTEEVRNAQARSERQRGTEAEDPG